MYKAHRIVIFLVVFIGIIATPLIMNSGRASEVPSPSLDTPVINSLDSSSCVEDVEFMRAQHMSMLNEWRTDAVRSGITEYTNSRGQIFEVSLENGCLNCHSNRVEFCDTCHTYAAVDPDCWNCHDAERSRSS